MSEVHANAYGARPRPGAAGTYSSLAGIEPMLLGVGRPATAPDGPLWTAEIKYDGYRLLVATADAGGSVRLQTRGGTDATRWYPELQALSALPPKTVLDGEVCCLDDRGHPDFNTLHARSRRRRWSPGDAPAVYCAFDLLVLKGKDIRAWPLKRRKRELAKLLASPPPSTLYVTDLPGQVRWLYQQALERRLEGVVAKRLDSVYSSGQVSSQWLKIKRPGGTPKGRFRRDA